MKINLSLGNLKQLAHSVARMNSSERGLMIIRMEIGLKIAEAELITFYLKDA